MGAADPRAAKWRIIRAGLVICVVGCPLDGRVSHGSVVLRAIGPRLPRLRCRKCSVMSMAWKRFASEFRCATDSRTDTFIETAITPALYWPVDWSLRRRNVYRSGCLSYAAQAPTRTMGTGVLLWPPPEGPLRRELGLGAGVSDIRRDSHAHARPEQRVDAGAVVRAVAPVTPRQFAWFRIIFGAYLAIHFAHLVPWGAELFRRDVNPASLNPTYGILPNVLTLVGFAGIRRFLVASLFALFVFG